MHIPTRWLLISALLLCTSVTLDGPDGSAPDGSDSAFGEAAGEEVAAVPHDAGTAVAKVAASSASLEEKLETLDVSEGMGAPSRLRAPPIATAKPLDSKLDLMASARLEGGRLVVHRGANRETLTVDPGLQSKLNDILKSYQTPYGAVVALDPRSGRVLAMAEHSEADPLMRGLCTKAIYPAASIFKLVTTSALLAAGVSPDVEECFHGGKRSLSAGLLQDSRRDSRCYALGTALAMSANVVFAKLTAKHLSAAKLLAMARAFGFNRQLDFPIPTEMSLAAIPQDPFGLSTAGAGFGDVFLSPLHGAAIASVAANGGLWRQPVLFESDVEKVAARPPERVMTEANARALTTMMAQTVRSGTARKAFHQRGFQVEGAVGKTGSLADRAPFRDYSWFVGFAPKDNPKVAVAAVVVNDPLWRIRATFLGREAMRLYLEQQKH